MIEVVVRRRLGNFMLDVAFQGPNDGVTVLFGPSGAGKSATLAAIAGVGPSDSARIVVGERVLADSKSGIAVPPAARRIGWVFQDGRLFPHLRVRGNLRYGLKRARGHKRIGFDDVVEMLGVGHLLDRGVQELSGGERQRIALGRAILSQPDLLLLDEPLAALDAARRHQILGFIKRLNADLRLPMIYVTHDVDEVRAIGDHVVRLEIGRVVAQGTAAIVAPVPIGFDVAIVARTAVATDLRIGAQTVTLPATSFHVGSTVELRIAADETSRADGDSG